MLYPCYIYQCIYPSPCLPCLSTALLLFLLGRVEHFLCITLLHKSQHCVIFHQIKWLMLHPPQVSYPCLFSIQSFALSMLLTHNLSSYFKFTSAWLHERVITELCDTYNSPEKRNASIAPGAASTDILPLYRKGASWNQSGTSLESSLSSLVDGCLSHGFLWRASSPKCCGVPSSSLSQLLEVDSSGCVSKSESSSSEVPTSSSGGKPSGNNLGICASAKASKTRNNIMIHCSSTIRNGIINFLVNFW